MTTEREWDGESYCCFEDCAEPATRYVLVGMVDDEEVVELYCEAHG